VETMFALAILTMLLGGLVSTMIQSRRLTEGSIDRMLASVIAQSYMEQIKAMQISIMANQTSAGAAQLTASFSLPTQASQTVSDPLSTTPSTVSIPALSALTAGTTPTGVIDNLKDFNPNANGVGTSNGVASTWALTWPNATSAGWSSATAATPYANDLHMNIWVWITDPNTGGTLANTAYGITMIYTWQVNDGFRIHYFADELHAIRSIVPSF